MIGSPWVWSLAGAAGEFSSPEFAFYADSYFGICSTSAVAHKRPLSSCRRCRWQVTAKHTCTLELRKVTVSWLCCPGIVWELTREKSSHVTCQGMLVCSHISLLSHCGPTLGLKEWKWCTSADLHIKIKTRRSQGTIQWTVPPSSHMWGKSCHHDDCYWLSNYQVIKKSQIHFNKTSFHV